MRELYSSRALAACFSSLPVNPYKGGSGSLKKTGSGFETSLYTCHGQSLLLSQPCPTLE